MEGQTRSDLDEIRHRSNIVEVVSEYVTLKKAGRSYLGLCPFHREKTPSFSVNPDRQIFYCFGCGEGGDIFSFLMKINNIAFPEALKMLAGKLGIALPQLTRQGEKGASRKEQLIKVNTFAAEYFSMCLTGGIGANARDYLKKRGIGSETIKEFRLGLAPDGWRNLKAALEKKRVPLKLAEEAGLLVAKKKGDDENTPAADYYDRFRARLMFPVENLSGQVIAFGGRVMGSGEPKYLNSPESLLYVKGRNLYGLSRCREDIRRQGHVIIVEGYFDALSLWAAGIRNVVATLGTALTKDHLDLLRRYTDQVVLVFDPDEAGRHAVGRSLKLFLAEKISAKIVILPENCDPDDYVRKFGREAMLAQVLGSQSLIDFYIDNNVVSGKGPEKKMASLREALLFLTGIEDVLQRNLFMKRVSERLGIEEQLLKAEVNKISPARKRPESAGKNEKKREIDPIELSLIQMLLQNPAMVRQAAGKQIFSYFLSSELQKVGEIIEKEGDAVVPSELIASLEDGELKKRLWQFMASESPFEDASFERLFTDTVRKIQVKWYRQRHQALKRELLRAQEMGDQDACRSILLEKEKLIKEEKAL